LIFNYYCPVHPVHPDPMMPRVSPDPESIYKYIKDRSGIKAKINSTTFLKQKSLFKPFYANEIIAVEQHFQNMLASPQLTGASPDNQRHFFQDIVPYEVETSDSFVQYRLRINFNKDFFLFLCRHFVREKNEILIDDVFISHLNDKIVKKVYARTIPTSLVPKWMKKPDEIARFTDSFIDKLKNSTRLKRSVYPIVLWINYSTMDSVTMYNLSQHKLSLVSVTRLAKLKSPRKSKKKKYRRNSLPEKLGPSSLSSKLSTTTLTPGRKNSKFRKPLLPHGLISGSSKVLSKSEGMTVDENSNEMDQKPLSDSSLFEKNIFENSYFFAKIQQTDEASKKNELP